MNNASKNHAKPFFLDGVAGKLFSIVFESVHSVASNKAILFISPFAEEMNKSRRMMAIQARRLSDMNYRVLLIDPYGTGDSEGDFSDATMDIWIDDYKKGIKWLKDNGTETIIVISVRFGSLVALKLLEENIQSIPIEHLIMWQPVYNAQLFLNQFLRLRMAADLIVSDKDKITTKDLRSKLDNGDSVEVAGYLLNPRLANDIDSVQLDEIVLSNNTHFDWIEMLPNEDRSISPAVIKIIEKWKTNNVNVSLHSVVGESFWNTPEISVSEELIQLSTNLVTNQSCNL